jgi:hypothetical protein
LLEKYCLHYCDSAETDQVRATLLLVVQFSFIYACLLLLLLDSLFSHSHFLQNELKEVVRGLCILTGCNVPNVKESVEIIFKYLIDILSAPASSPISKDISSGAGEIPSGSQQDPWRGCTFIEVG